MGASKENLRIEALTVTDVFTGVFPKPPFAPVRLQTQIAKDVETGVTTQGKSRATTQENPDDAVALRAGEHGRAPTGEELQAAEIGSADNTPGDQEPPDILE